MNGLLEETIFVIDYLKGKVKENITLEHMLLIDVIIEDYRRILKNAIHDEKERRYNPLVNAR